ncbi:MAG: hypothetical protein ACREFS_03200 [Acetobacteraceae bacterium]
MLAAGFAPPFRESAIDGLAAAKPAMDRVLQAHKPYPVTVVDRHWNVVLSNGALLQLYQGCSGKLPERPVNATRAHWIGMRVAIIHLPTDAAVSIPVIVGLLPARALGWLWRRQLARVGIFQQRHRSFWPHAGCAWPS